MGSGKSTTGKKLASLLGWSYIDLDSRIEKETGQTIPELFSRAGEEHFREIESDILKNLSYETNTVVSTGGGTPCNGDNMNYMIETGLTVYLKLTPGQLKSRLSESSTERPLIKGLDKEDLLDFIREKLAFREKWYNQAEIIIEGIDVDINSLNTIVKTRLDI